MTSHSAKRKGLTWVLALVFLLLIALIAWMEIDRTPSTTQQPNSINTVSISRAGHDDIKLIRSNGSDDAQWQMIAPFTLSANSQRIEPLLALGTADMGGYETSEVDMVAAGLDNPGASITIGDRTLLLGRTDIDGERRYALVDNKVSLLPEWVWSLIHGGVTAFADLSVFSALPDTLFLLSDSSATSIGDIDRWRDLQADKIVPWPTKLESNATQNLNDEAELARWSISTSQDNDAEKLADIIQFTEHTVIQTDPGFAYAISNTRLNQLLSE